MCTEMTKQLLRGKKLITGSSSALITGPCVNRRLHTTPQEGWRGGREEMREG